MFFYSNFKIDIVGIYIIYGIYIIEVPYSFVGIPKSYKRYAHNINWWNILYMATYVCVLKRTRAISSYIGASCRCDMCAPHSKTWPSTYAYDEIQQKASAHISFIFLHPLLKIFKYKNPLYWIRMFVASRCTIFIKMCVRCWNAASAAQIFFFLQKS